MTTGGRAAIFSPWPGPVPYDEARWRFFKGREEDVQRVSNRLYDDRLVLLSADSGVGKSSFLRAGLIPRMRRLRHRALVSGEPSARPAVVLVRDWLTRHGDSGGSFLATAIHATLDDDDLKRATIEAYAEDEAMADSIRLDFERLASVPLQDDAYAYVAQLQATVQNLALVFDQFEEALQGSQTQTEDLLQSLVMLYRGRIATLISYRREFEDYLRPLWEATRQREKISYLLPRIGTATLEQALTLSAAEANLLIERDALKRLMNWLKGDNSQPSLIQSTASVRTSRFRDASAVDLLKLQAILLQIYEVASAAGPADSGVSITTGTLNQLLQEERRALRAEGAIAEVHGPGFISRALERYIDRRVLPRPTECRLSNSTIGGWDAASEHLLQIRHAAAKMAEYFSTGSTKVPQYLGSLVANAWSDEWLVLGTDAEHVENVLTPEQLADTEVGLGARLELSDSSVHRDAGILSATPRRNAWSRRDAANYLLQISRDALEELIEGNVLRSKGASSPWTYELVHDGFGPAFADWAKDQLRSPIDATVAITAQRGLEFNWDQVTGTVRDACWSGCWIGPTAHNNAVRLNNTRFQNCDLHGTLFENCEFTGGSFKDCILDFVIFLNCKFLGNPKAPFSFDGGRAVGLTINGGSANYVKFDGMYLDMMRWSPSTDGNQTDVFDLANVTLTNCTLKQWRADNVKVDDSLRIASCLVELSDLLGFTNSVAEVTCRDSKFIYCPVNEELRDVITRPASGNELYPNEIVPERLEDVLERG